MTASMTAGVFLVILDSETAIISKSVFFLFFSFYNIYFTRHKSQVKKAKIKINKTRLNIQFGQTLSMYAALEIYWLSAYIAGSK